MCWVKVDDALFGGRWVNAPRAHRMVWIELALLAYPTGGTIELAIGAKGHVPALVSLIGTTRADRQAVRRAVEWLSSDEVGVLEFVSDGPKLSVVVAELPSSSTPTAREWHANGTPVEHQRHASGTRVARQWHASGTPVDQITSVGVQTVEQLPALGTPKNRENREDKEKNRIENAREPEKQPPKKGTRITPDWTPPDSIYQYACDNSKVRFGAQAVLDHLEDFRDYWSASSTSNAVKRDWTAAFRTWLRKARAYAPDAPKSVPGAWRNVPVPGAPIVKSQRISKRQYIEMMESMGMPTDGWVDDPGPHLYPHPEDA